MDDDTPQIPRCENQNRKIGLPGRGRFRCWTMRASSQEIVSWIPLSFTSTDVRDGLVIGRSERFSRLVIPDSSISREHAKVFCTDEGLFIEDLGAQNGVALVRGSAMPIDGSRDIDCDALDGPLRRGEPELVIPDGDRWFMFGDVKVEFFASQTECRSFADGMTVYVAGENDAERERVDISPFVAPQDRGHALVRLTDRPTGHSVSRPWGNMFLETSYSFNPQPEDWIDGMTISIFEERMTD